MALHIGHYGDVPRTLHWDILRTLAGDIPWRYIEDHMGKSVGRLLGMSSGGPQDVIMPSGEHL